MKYIVLQTFCFSILSKELENKIYEIFDVAFGIIGCLFFICIVIYAMTVFTYITYIAYFKLVKNKTPISFEQSTNTYKIFSINIKILIVISVLGLIVYLTEIALTFMLLLIDFIIW